MDWAHHQTSAVQTSQRAAFGVSRIASLDIQAILAPAIKTAEKDQHKAGLQLARDHQITVEVQVRHNHAQAAPRLALNTIQIAKLDSQRRVKRARPNVLQVRKMQDGKAVKRLTIVGKAKRQLALQMSSHSIHSATRNVKQTHLDLDLSVGAIVLQIRHLVWASCALMPVRYVLKTSKKNTTRFKVLCET